ncbi:MAG: hypothetical protein K9M75_01090, partial [Phycisphaerae bacterium]|nr:hypothetical protein [Phycisphaerae bacterium]
KELLAAKFKTSGLEELENVEEVVDFTQSKTSKDIIEKRIIEFLKMGRRLDSRDVIMHYYRLDKKQAYNKMEELMRENVL